MLKKISKATEKGIAQILGQSGKELGRVSPVILKKAIEQKLLHKTPFRLLGKFSRKKICMYSENWTLLKENYQQTTKVEQ